MPFPVATRVVPWLMSYFVKEITGLENLPKQGGFVMAANHASHLDEFLILGDVMRATGRKAHALADQKTWFEDSRVKRWIARRYETIPVARGDDSTASIGMAVDCLRRDEIVLIYPEGTRSRDGQLQRGKTGVSRIALAGRVPIVPVGLRGTFELLPRGKSFPDLGRRKTVSIAFGQPIQLDACFDRQDHGPHHRWITDWVMLEIGRLARLDYEFAPPTWTAALAGTQADAVEGRGNDSTRPRSGNIEHRIGDDLAVRRTHPAAQVAPGT